MLSWLFRCYLVLCGFTEKSIYKGELPKKSNLNSLQVQERAWHKKGVVLLGEVDTPIYAVFHISLFQLMGANDSKYGKLH